MDGLRVIHSLVPRKACSRCDRPGHRWDRIAGQAFCPHCQEALAQGEAEPLVERTVRQSCAICDHDGTLCYHTFPIQADAPIEMHLCAEHLRGLLRRHLGPQAFRQLRRQLNHLDIDVCEIFLLHDAFYDRNGRALQPVDGDEE